MFHTAPAEGILTLQIGETPDDLLLTPTDAGIVAANMKDIQDLALVANDIQRLNTGSTANNIDRLEDSADNIDRLNIGDTPNAIDRVGTVETVAAVNRLSEGWTANNIDRLEDSADAVDRLAWRMWSIPT